MNKNEIIDHYRNLYQINMEDKNDLISILEEYEKLIELYQNIIYRLKKRNENLAHSVLVLENLKGENNG